ncbi:MAG: hypothetical protein CL537_07795 [Alcanivoracaceae bacterium]|nr:hypothetical protein [Alcanivoracaceae bacterium]|tara:strand:- start:4504 stop:4731 length:228 start_codon:yes stop_codon:yes gene_type:complete
MDKVESYIRKEATRLANEAGISDAATLRRIAAQAVDNYRRDWGGAVDAIQAAIRIHRPMRRQRREFGPQPIQTTI